MENNNPVSVFEKVIFITGALGQIGKEISFSFLKQGAYVVFADLNMSAKETFIQELIDLKISFTKFTFIQIDITSEESCVKAVELVIKDFGRIDVWIVFT